MYASVVSGTGQFIASSSTDNFLLMETLRALMKERFEDLRKELKNKILLHLVCQSYGRWRTFTDYTCQIWSNISVVGTFRIKFQLFNESIGSRWHHDKRDDKSRNEKCSSYRNYDVEQHRWIHEKTVLHKRDINIKSRIHSNSSSLIL